MSEGKESRIVSWLDDLKYYAKCFYNEIVSQNKEFGDIVKYDDSVFEEVLKKYKFYNTGFHSLIEGDLIDRHKILAAIMLAVTNRENLIFKIDYEAIERSSLEDFPYWVIYPNEFYLCTALLPILTDFVLATKKSVIHGLNKDNYDIRFPDTVVWWEKDIFESYSDQFSQLLSTLISIDDISIKCSLLASHLIYFYELAYDCAINDLSRVYYDMVV